MGVFSIPLIDSDWCWLILIDADWLTLILIDTGWLLLLLIDADWFWVMLIGADADSNYADVDADAADTADEQMSRWADDLMLMQMSSNAYMRSYE